MVKRIIIALICLCIFGSISYYNAVNVNPKQFKIREERINSYKIDKDMDGLLIGCFSDLYYGTYIDDEFVDRAFNSLNSFKPDLIIFGGDLIDPETLYSLSESQENSLIEKLSSLKATYGKFAVLGDQDHGKLEVVEKILKASGFEILNNTSRLICIDKDSYFNLAGIDSLAGGSPDCEAALAGINSNYFTFVVSHSPDIFDSAMGFSTDYLFAGHSRGGQIYLPLISYFTREYGCKKYFRGKLTKNGKTLDITNGLGMTSTAARLNADAEIVFYTLRHE